MRALHDGATPGLTPMVPGGRRRSVRHAAVAWGVASVLAAGSGHAAVIDVPGDFAHVGAALWAAAPGDTILVGPGVYAENLVWPPTPQLVLLGTDGPHATVLDGGGVDQVLGIYTGVDTTTVIRGFTLRNGHAAGT